MDDFLRLALLVIAILILSFILIESRWRRRRFKTAEMNVQEFNNSEFKTPPFKNSEFKDPEFKDPEFKAPALKTQRDEDCIFNLTPSESFNDISSVSSDTDALFKEPHLPSTQDYMVISVFAKPNTQFASYDLLQSISATGMQFGEMNIFHYYSVENGKKKILFSLASATNPGEFNLDRMGDFSCVGLTLFLDLQHSPQPKIAFDKMVAIAEQLADDLEGELRAGSHTPWNDNIHQQYKNQINSIRYDAQKV